MLKTILRRRHLSNLATCSDNIYKESYIVYNKYNHALREETRTYFVNNKERHTCVSDTGNICQYCKGSGIVFNTKSYIDFNYYKLCENCRGTGYA